MNKILVFINNFIKLFFLNKNQKRFINHNYDILRTNKVDKSSQKIILMELNEKETNTIAYSYFAYYSSKKYNAKLAAFFPRIPRNFYKKMIWKFRNVFGSPAYSIFKSFGVNSFIIPSLNKHLSKESSRIYNEQLGLINNKDDVENIIMG